MRVTTYSLAYCGLILMAACGEQDDDAGSLMRGGLDTSSVAYPVTSAEDADRNTAADTRTVGEFSDDSPDEPPPPQLECDQGGPTAAVQVVFRCDQITVETCKDLANVVIEYEDGSRHRFEGQTGHVNVFTVGSVTHVWVEAGDHQSGEGPGYGERFDAPTTPCTPNEANEPASSATGI